MRCASSAASRMSRACATIQRTRPPTFDAPSRFCTEKGQTRESCPTTKTPLLEESRCGACETSSSLGQSAKARTCRCRPHVLEDSPPSTLAQRDCACPEAPRGAAPEAARGARRRAAARLRADGASAPSAKAQPGADRARPRRCPRGEGQSRTARRI